MDGTTALGGFRVETTNYRGSTAEELAEHGGSKQRRNGVTGHGATSAG